MEQFNDIPPSKNSLEIIIESGEFQKPFNYFIAIQLDGNQEKVN